MATLRNWEQGRRTPEGPALALLRVAPAEPLRLELEAFIARIRDQGCRSRVSPASVLAVTRTLEAIGRSLRRNGAPEQLEEVWK